jgi:hypothetical protein
MAAVGRRDHDVEWWDNVRLADKNRAKNFAVKAKRSREFEHGR